ncbi:CUB and sushi domain-containing protein 1 isoform X7 [Aphelenchoides besseyi]|nr:CUB and sushi domain-containing protein 1 isoform X7 [Aphelenchoides besseyi]
MHFDWFPAMAIHFILLFATSIALPVLNALPVNLIATTCHQETYHGASGFVQSNNFPHNYSNELDCLQQINVAPGNRIQLIFYAFETELNSDVLYLYDGQGTSSPLIAKLSGGGEVMRKVYVSTGNSLTLNFVSDFDHTYKGYYIRWDQIKPVESTPKVMNCGGPVFFSDSYNVIVSPNWPKEYPNEANCYYTIRVQSNALGIQLRLNYFDTELNSDVLDVYSGSVESPAHLIAKLSGKKERDSTIVIPNTVGMLVFSSDFDFTAPGFSITYEAITK